MYARRTYRFYFVIEEKRKNEGNKHASKSEHYELKKEEEKITIRTNGTQKKWRKIETRGEEEEAKTRSEHKQILSEWKFTTVKCTTGWPADQELLDLYLNQSAVAM